MKEWRIMCASHQVLLGSQNHGKQHGAGEKQICVKGEKEKKLVKNQEQILKGRDLRGI